MVYLKSCQIELVQKKVNEKLLILGIFEWWKHEYSFIPKPTKHSIGLAKMILVHPKKRNTFGAIKVYLFSIYRLK